MALCGNRFTAARATDTEQQENDQTNKERSQRLGRRPKMVRSFHEYQLARVTAFCCVMNGY